MNQPNRKPANAFSAFQPLERRRLLSATVVDDALVIAGTEANDTIAVVMDAATGQMNVTVNGVTEAFDPTTYGSLNIDAGAGDDDVRIDANVTMKAVVEGGLGDDLIYGGSGDDNLSGGEGNDTVAGGNGSDKVRGAAGDDFLNGNAGNDKLWGHDGHDTLFGGDHDDLLRGGDGDDVLKGEAGFDTVLGHAGNDDLMGMDDDDLLRGHGGNDRLFDGRGNDALDGGDGDDELQASAGTNVLVGGYGSDTFAGPSANSVFADYDATDYRAAHLEDARDGGVKRFKDETTGLFTPEHPAYDKLVAAFADGRGPKELRDALDDGFVDELEDENESDEQERETPLTDEQAFHAFLATLDPNDPQFYAQIDLWLADHPNIDPSVLAQIPNVSVPLA